MPPEFAGQNICSACEGDGQAVSGAPCRFCKGTGESEGSMTTPRVSSALTDEQRQAATRVLAEQGLFFGRDLVSIDGAHVTWSDGYNVWVAPAIARRLGYIVRGDD